MSNISANIKFLRQQHKQSQQNAAQSLGYSRRTLSAWESGKKLPSATAIIDLCIYYGCTADWLLGIESADSKQKSTQSSAQQT